MNARFRHDFPELHSFDPIRDPPEFTTPPDKFAWMYCPIPVGNGNSAQEIGRYWLKDPLGNQYEVARGEFRQRLAMFNESMRLTTVVPVPPNWTVTRDIGDWDFESSPARIFLLQLVAGGGNSPYGTSGIEATRPTVTLNPIGGWNSPSVAHRPAWVRMFGTFGPDLGESHELKLVIRPQGGGDLVTLYRFKFSRGLTQLGTSSGLVTLHHVVPPQWEYAMVFTSGSKVAVMVDGPADLPLESPSFDRLEISL